MEGNLSKIPGINPIESENSFFEIIKKDKVVVYFLVDWSGQERFSRIIIAKVLSELQLPFPFYYIDCSGQEHKKVTEWLLNQSKKFESFYYGGYGETLLIEKETIINYIKYPGELGIEKTRGELLSWINK